MFVGRNEETELLDELFLRCVGGQGQVVLVTGGLASGKTEFLRTFLDRAGELGVVLLTATGSRAEHTLRMGVLGQLLQGRGIPAEWTDLAAELVSGEAAAPGGDEADALSPAHAGVARRVCAAVLEPANHRPVVIAVDDVQFADGPSLQVLLYLIRRIRDAQVLVILGERAHPYSTRPLFRAELTRYPHHHIHLAPLSYEGVAELVTTQLGEAAAAGLAPTFHALTGGNPLLVRALVADQQRMGGTDGQLRVGTGFAQAVLDCLHRWETRMLDVARGAAVLGDDAAPDLLAQLLGARLDSVVQGLDSLIEAGLLVTARFRHEAAEVAVLDDIPLRERARLHSRSAELLYQRGAAPSTVARHIVAADQAAGPWVVTVLREAGQQALADDDMEFAARCLKLALRANPKGRDLAIITTMLATVEWRANPSAAALRLAPLRDALADRVLTGREVAAVIRCHLWRGDLAEAGQALSALAESREPADARIVAEHLLACQLIYGTRWGTLPGAPARPVDDGDPAGDDADPWTRAATTLATMPYRGTRDDVVNSARYILQSSRLSDSTLEVVMTALQALTNADEPDVAAYWCEMLLDEAARRGAATWQALLNGVRADIALARGEVATAAESARTALDLLPVPSWGVFAGLPLSTLVSAATAMGRREEAAAALQRIAPEAMFHTVFGARYLHARGHHHLETDQVLAAFSDFQRCGDLMRERDLDVPDLVPWRSDLALAHLRLGHRDTARKLVAEQLERLGGFGSRVRGVTLRVLAECSDLRQRPALLREAVDHLQRSGDRLELARAMVSLSNVHHELGEFGRARMMAYQARQEAKLCDIEVSLLVGGRAEEDAQQESERIESVLSDAEQRVATLAAMGHTNREISQRLFITSSTVEQHLTRVYRKLNVAGRKDLPAELSPSRNAGMPDEQHKWADSNAN